MDDTNAKQAITPFNLNAEMDRCRESIAKDGLLPQNSDFRNSLKSPLLYLLAMSEAPNKTAISFIGNDAGVVTMVLSTDDGRMETVPVNVTNLQFVGLGTCLALLEAYLYTHYEGGKYDRES